jgi:molybdopterin converting factor subunit 1
MELAVHLFGPAREAIGTSCAIVEVAADATVAKLLSALAATHPELESLLARSRVAVNHGYAEPSERLAPDDEIAVIPPVGGG